MQDGDYIQIDIPPREGQEQATEERQGVDITQSEEADAGKRPPKPQHTDHGYPREPRTDAESTNHTEACRSPSCVGQTRQYVCIPYTWKTNRSQRGWWRRPT